VEIDVFSQGASEEVDIPPIDRLTLVGRSGGVGDQAGHAFAAGIAPRSQIQL
jgi:hypothetical protein